MRAFSQVTGLFIILFLIITTAVALEQYVIPKRSSVQVYENMTRKIYEQPVFTLALSDRVKIIEEKGDFYKIQDPTGRQGWVEKRLVAMVKTAKRFGFDGIAVQGYEGGQTALFIPGMSPAKDEYQLFLDRSFREYLKTNKDREQIERQSEQK